MNLVVSLGSFGSDITEGLTVTVLHAIKTRYEMHEPYTYSGIVLVSHIRVMDPV